MIVALFRIVGVLNAPFSAWRNDFGLFSRRECVAVVRVGIIGTGFVADYYALTFANHPALRMVAAWDVDPAARERFCSHWKVPVARSQDDLFETCRIVLVLTPPETHAGVVRDALDAGRHVYCEKPLALCERDVLDLDRRAKAAGLGLASAPANARSDAFAKVAQMLAEESIGPLRAVQASVIDGAVHHANWRTWRSVSGAPWPGLHEFRLGCTLEHVGYALSWLGALLGAPARVDAASATTAPFKDEALRGERLGPDFSHALLRYETADGPVEASVTTSLQEPRDRSLRLIGERGTLAVRDLWDHRSPVQLFDPSRGCGVLSLQERTEGRLQRALAVNHLPGRTVAYESHATARLPRYPSRIDFAGGAAALADALDDPAALAALREEAVTSTLVALAINDGRRGYTLPSRREVQAPPLSPAGLELA